MNQSGPGMLFITGTSRSGTTTMADFLREDRRIVMGRERYAWRLKQPDAFVPALFGKERFCLDYRPDDSHHRSHQPYYADAYRAFDSAAWVGDKLPMLFEHYDVLFERFPGSRVIYMARNVFDVAESYRKRADESKRRIAAGEDAGRMWPVDRGWEQAIPEWNASVCNTLDRVETESILVVDYDKLYVDTTQLATLYLFLSLELPESMARLWRTKAEERLRIEATRSSELGRSVRDEIARRADLEGFSRLLAHAATV